MIVGSLGDIFFSVSANTVQTLNELSIKKSITFGTHKVVGKKALLEFTGVEPDVITFTIELSAYLGVNPTEMLDRLNHIAEAGKPVSFIMGTRVYGTGLWVITDLGTAHNAIYKDGALISATVNVTLKEYVAG